MSTSFRGAGDPANEGFRVGFRMATVPEPSTYALLLMTGAGALYAWKRRKRSL